MRWFLVVLLVLIGCGIWIGSRIGALSPGEQATVHAALLAVAVAVLGLLYAIWRDWRKEASSEQASAEARAFFNLIQGRWVTTWYRAKGPDQQEITFDQFGNGFVGEPGPKADLTLEKVRYDAKNRSAKFEKYRSNPRFEIHTLDEELVIGPDGNWMQGMTGAVGSQKHRVEYVRACRLQIHTKYPRHEFPLQTSNRAWEIGFEAVNNSPNEATVSGNVIFEDAGKEIRVALSENTQFRGTCPQGSLKIPKDGGSSVFYGFTSALSIEGREPEFLRLEIRLAQESHWRTFVPGKGDGLQERTTLAQVKGSGGRTTDGEMTII